MAYFKGRYNGQKHNRTVGAPARIDIDAIYRELKSAIEERARLEIEQKSVWDYVKRYNADRSERLIRINAGIADCTHRINLQLSQLSRYNKTHRAMQLAKTYLESEIARLQRITNRWDWIIRDVEAGRSCLINGSGRSSTDTTSSREYLKSRYERIARLTKWLEHVKRFAV